MTLRVVFDTSTVISALAFPNGQISWLRRHWRDGECIPLLSNFGASELSRVLNYPKFRLSTNQQRELLDDYLPYCEVVELTENCPVNCRDPKDQPFLDLAQAGRAAVMVSSDKDLLVLARTTAFQIETPEVYRRRFSGRR